MNFLQEVKKYIRQNYLGNFFKNLIAGWLYTFAQALNNSSIRQHGRIIASIYDLFAVVLSWIIANIIPIIIMVEISYHYGDGAQSSFLLIMTCWKQVLSDLIIIVPVQLILFRYYGLYRGFWTFASIQDLKKILFAAFLGGFISWLLLRAGPVENPIYSIFPRSIVVLLHVIFLCVLLSSARIFARFLKDYKHLHQDFQRAIIIGAGNAGEGLARDLLRDGDTLYKPVAFVDDDLRKRGREIHNVRVVGTIAELPALVKKYHVDLVLIAIPSASAANMRNVVDVCEKANVRYYTLPGIKDLANGRVSINVLRHVSLEDLLGRYPVTCQWMAIKEYLKNKTILVTGGGGSIGSELCRQIISLGDIARLIVVDRNEYNLYSIDMELRQQFPTCEIHSVLLSVTDRIGIQTTLAQYKPHMVFHAAAYKHVPLLESQPRAAMYNNIIGTQIIAEETAKANVDTFVLISSDKAVNPTNIMGATKRAAEYFCQNIHDHAEKTKFITVRFGNVLDSAGSVIPLFRKQIESGGPVTVTHPKITRFFMTIPEASQLILQAAFLGNGGEIFVLDMGDPIKIRYLAEKMISLAGKVVGQDIQIIYTGLRPGEKLYEECFYSDETLQSTAHTKIMKAQTLKRNFIEIQKICQQIEAACESSETTMNELMALLEKIVPEYVVQKTRSECTIENIRSWDQQLATVNI